MEEVDEADEFDVPAAKSGRKQTKTHFHVLNSALEAPNIDDHLNANLGQNMNLLFYNFNNSRAQTAVGNKRAPSLGVE